MNGKFLLAMIISAVMAVSMGFSSTVEGRSVKAGGGKIDCADKSTWPSGKRAARVEQMCKNKEKRNAKSADKLKKKEEWKKKHAKGKDMEKVFDANNWIVPREEDIGSQIIWTYRSKGSRARFAECKEYVFEESGKLKSRRTYQCE